MCFFWKRRKQKRQEELLKQQEEAKKQEEIKNEEPAQPIKEEVKPEPEPVKEEAEVEEPVKEEPVKEEVKTKPVKAAPKKAAKKVVTKKAEAKPEVKEEETSSRYSGKYEVYPEAGMYKFRLKASNGEILIVSNGYVSLEGAKAGIETMKKNIKVSNSNIITDKSNFSQFRFLTTTGARVVVSGEYYNNLASAQSALDSVKKFAFTNKIVELKKIPTSEIREEKIVLNPVDKAANGKIELFIEDGKYYGRLVASNGEVLFVTEDYSTKASLVKGLATIEEKVSTSSFDVCRDKQNRYQFKIYSSNGQQLVVGQTYPSKDSAISATISVRRFIQDAKTVDLTLKAKAVEEKRRLLSKKPKLRSK